LVLRPSEDLIRLADLDDLSLVKNAVRSATRAACCMLWVTMTIV
jgi:hypothetical protein